MKEFTANILTASCGKLEQEFDTVEQCKQWCKSQHHKCNSTSHFEIHHSIGELDYLHGIYHPKGIIWQKRELIFNLRIAA